MEKKEYLLVVGALTLIAVSAAAGYWLGKAVAVPVVINSQPEQVETNSETKPTSTATIIESRRIINISLEEVSLPKEIGTKLQWHEPKQISPLNIVSSSKMEEEAREVGVFFELATFKYGDQNGRLILVKYFPTEMGPVTAHRLVEFQGKYVVLGKYSDWYDTTGFYDKAKVVFDPDLSILELNFPDKITGPRLNQVLLHEESSIFIRQPENKILAFRDAEWGRVYTSTGTGGFYLSRPDGYDELYVFVPDFNVLGIVWSDGTKNQTNYSYRTAGGCGFLNYVAVVEGLNINKDLQPVGKTSGGDTLYGLKDSQHPRLKEMYETSYNPAEEKKFSYEVFLSSRPLFYWVDPFGRLIEFTKSSYMMAAECGKPVIYLYPPEKTEVSVRVKPMLLTYSEPEHKEGWKVVAEPTGRLTEVGTNRVYPFLYWEGLGKYYDMPKKGFVVKREAVSTFLDSKLKLLGLNTKEANDFKDFWLPRMQAKPYYFVTFMGTSYMDELAPLNIEPKPDTIIRILMDFKGLDAPIIAEPMKFSTPPARQGFTVIEWGGVLGR